MATALLVAAVAAAAAGAADVRLQLSPAIPAAVRPFAARASDILSRQITSRCNASVVNTTSFAAVVIELQINASLGPEGYAVRAGGAAATVAIAGGDARGLLFGAGKFLRTSQFNGPRTAPFVPGSWRGEGAPQLRDSFRAAYFAVHYGNFYAAAPVGDLIRYVEDIALWGVNTVVVLLPGPSAFANGERTTAPDAPQIPLLKNRTRILLQLVADIGLSPGVIVVPNQGFDNGARSVSARARGNCGGSDQRSGRASLTAAAGGRHGRAPAGPQPNPVHPLSGPRPRARQPWGSDLRVQRARVPARAHADRAGVVPGHRPGLDRVLAVR